MENKQYVGFIEPKIEEQEEQGAYFLGASPVPQKPILQTDADWEDALPKEEEQNLFGIETFNCVAFNATSQIETYEKIAFGEDNNYSDRWLGIIAGTDPNKGGNDPQVVYEAIRKYGLIPEEMLPFSEDIKNVEEYYSFKGGDKDTCYEAGKKWLSQKRFMHEWIFKPSDSPELKLLGMKQAYNYSPLALAVYAWNQNSNGIYVALGNSNHWTGAYGLKDKLIKVYDSYDPFKKLVDQEIKWCKRIHIEKISEVDQKKISIIQQLLNLSKKLLDLLLKKKLKNDTIKPMEIIPPKVEPIKPEVIPTSQEIPFRGDTIIDTNQELPDALLNCLLWAETRSSLDYIPFSALNAIGDKNLKDKAYGCLQIRLPVILDVNRRYKLNYKPNDLLGNSELSIKICTLYLRMWANKAHLKREANVQDCCRIFNGGPSGHWKTSTIPYWNSIKEHFDL